MSGLFGHLVGVMIVILMVTFIGIWVWAWRPKHRDTFGALASIPMQDGADGDQGLHSDNGDRDDNDDNDDDDGAHRHVDDDGAGVHRRVDGDEHRLEHDGHRAVGVDRERGAPRAEREAAS